MHPLRLYIKHFHPTLGTISSSIAQTFYSICVYKNRYNNTLQPPVVEHHKSETLSSSFGNNICLNKDPQWEKNKN